MNLIELREKIRYYFEDAADLSDAVVTGAINAARKAAESQYAFEMNKKVLQTSLDARAGAIWTSLPLLNTSTPLLPVRSIKRAYALSNDSLGMTEIKFEYRGMLPYTQGELWHGYYPYSELDRRIFLVGDRLYFYPFGPEGTLVLCAFDGYVWMDDYPDSGDVASPDWMLTHFYQYLFWKAAWDLNYKKKEWVPRQEGNLQLSLDMAEAEYRRMIIWDSSIKSYQTTLNQLM